MRVFVLTRVLAAGVLVLVCCAVVVRAQSEQQPVQLFVDAREIYRGVVFVRETIPVSPGALTLVYPKWIPGNHRPSGPLGDLAQLRIAAGSKPLAWQRDPLDLYAFHVDVPAGIDAVTATFTALLNAQDDTLSSDDLAALLWNRVVLYHAGVDAQSYFVQPSIVLPSGWNFASALQTAQHTGDRVTLPGELVRRTFREIGKPELDGNGVEHLVEPPRRT